MEGAPGGVPAQKMQSQPQPRPQPQPEPQLQNEGVTTPGMEAGSHGVATSRAAAAATEGGTGQLADVKERGRGMPNASEIRLRRRTAVLVEFEPSGLFNDAVQRLTESEEVNVWIPARSWHMIPDIETELRRRGFEAKRVDGFNALTSLCEHMRQQRHPWKTHNGALHAYPRDRPICQCGKQPDAQWINISLAPRISCCSVS